jgi:hypothetical protein
MDPPEGSNPLEGRMSRIEEALEVILNRLTTVEGAGAQSTGDGTVSEAEGRKNLHLWKAKLREFVKSKKKEGDSGQSAEKSVDISGIGAGRDFKIPKFDGNNYFAWKPVFLRAMETIGADDLILGHVEMPYIDEKIFYTIPITEDVTQQGS